MRHLSDEAFADALEGQGEPSSLAHLGECAACRERLTEAEGGLALVRGIDVPEPPAPYWEALRRNVSRRIAEPEPHRRRPTGWLAPLAAAAALVAAFVLRAPARPPAPVASPAGERALPAWSALPPLEEDEAVPLLEGVLVTAGPSAWDEGRGVDAYVAGLTEDESSALAAALAASAARWRDGGDL